LEAEALVAGYGGIYIDKIPVRILSKHYLVKPLHVYVGGLENSISIGYTLVKKPVVLGSVGVVRVIEAGYGASSELSGSVAIVSPITRHGILGLDIDGLISKYTVVPMESIVKTISSLDPLYSISYHLAVASKVAEEVKGANLLIIGGGLESIALAILSREHVSRLAVYTHSKNSARILRRHGVEAYGKIQDIKCCFDTVFYGSMTPIYLYHILEHLGSNDLVIHLNPFIRYVHISIRSPRRVEFVKPVPEERHYKCIEGLRKIIERYVRRIHVRSLSEVLGLLPVNSTGVIVSLT